MKKAASEVPADPLKLNPRPLGSEKKASKEAQEVANLPDFVNMANNRAQKLTSAEMLD